MSEEVDPNRLRVGDSERNAAISALSDHLTAGRLDMDEFGKRSAQANAARTDADLQLLFDDLPAPHPPHAGGLPDSSTVAAPLAPQPYSSSSYPSYSATPATAVPATTAPVNNPARRDASKAQRVYAGLMGVAGLLAVILYFVIDSIWPDSSAWLVFLLIPLAGAVGAAIWGRDWRR